MQYLPGCCGPGGSTGTLTVTGVLSEMTTIGLVMVLVFIIMRRMLSTLREVQASSGNIHYKERSRNVRTRSRCNLWHMDTTVKEHYEQLSIFNRPTTAHSLLWGEARFWNLLQFGKFIIIFFWSGRELPTANTAKALPKIFYVLFLARYFQVHFYTIYKMY